MKVSTLFCAALFVIGLLYMKLPALQAEQLPAPQLAEQSMATGGNKVEQATSVVISTTRPQYANGQCPNMVTNGGFEQARDWWMDSAQAVFYDTRNVFTGNQAMTIDASGLTAGEVMGFWQRLTLPANISTLTLDFESLIIRGNVDQNVYIRIADTHFDNILQSQPLRYDCNCGWQHFSPTLDLASLAGRTINLSVDVFADGAIDEVAFDDITLTVCQSGPTATPVPRPILLSPQGEIHTDLPTFSWRAMPGAINYRLWVNQYGTPEINGRINQIYTPAAANCATGDTCTVSPDIPIQTAAGAWWITAYFDGGAVASESQGSFFTINLSGSPTATATLLPTPTATPTATPVVNTPTSTPTPPASPSATSTSTATTDPAATASLTPAPPTIVPSATPTDGVPPVGDGDRFERDDDCTSAGALATDGIPQRHTFHAQGDADWLRFPVAANTPYIIEGDVPNDSPTDLLLAIYDRCNSGAIETQDYGFSPAVRLAFTATQSTNYYIRLVNSKADQYGTDHSYQIAIRAVSPAPTTGMLIIVAGRNQEGDFLQEQIHNVTNRVYRLWRNQGYPADRIRYLATDLDLDPDNDGRADVYALADNANLREAITEWAAAGLQASQSLTLYMMDHGDYDKLYLDEPRRERLDPQDLHEWLNALEAAVPDVHVTVIIEACNSGSFIDPDTSISKPGRVIITSAGAYDLAWTTNTGARFSDALLDGLAIGKTLLGAFYGAQANTRQGYVSQTPWLDDDGDRIPNDGDDGILAAQLSFRSRGLNSVIRWQPWVVQANVRNSNLVATTAQPQDRKEIWAEVRDNDKIEQVWAVIYPPSYRPPTTGDELVSGPPPITLQPRGNDQYAGLYGEFDEIGTYRIVIYALDDEGLHSPAKELLFQHGSQIYLPVVLR